MEDDIVRRKGYLTLGSRLKRISERLQTEVQALMDDNDVPVQAFQYPLLASLDENGPMEIGALAKSLGVSQPGVTRNVAQLAEQGFVSLSKGTKDKRQKIVSLSPAGHDVVHHGRSTIWPQIEHCLQEILTEEPGTLLDHLDRLEQGLRAASFNQRLADKARDKQDD